jgi:tetratricopeptide (TPR) repeat protein
MLTQNPILSHIIINARIFHKLEDMDTIVLNNDAVVLMRQGNLQEVAPYFISALVKLHRVDQRKHVDRTDKFAPSFLSVRSVPLEHSLFNTSSYQDHHVFSLFDRPLVIDDAELVLASSSFAVESSNCASAVILFNMGLALQLQGMQSLCPLQTSFEKALRFYRMAKAILERSTGSNDEVDGLVYLAVANNMGHIYSHFCETSKAKRCLEWLQSILEVVNGSEVCMLGDEYHPFQMNVLILHGQDAVAAAAA